MTGVINQKQTETRKNRSADTGKTGQNQKGKNSIHFTVSVCGL